MKRLLIIPARSGSKRIKNKNTRNFCGKPMLLHAIDNANESGLFEEIHVSTDSKEVSNIAEQHHFAPAFTRPIALSCDDVGLLPVVNFVVDRYKEKGRLFDEVWLLLPCSPLINSRILSAAAKDFANFKPRLPLVSVTEFPAPIEWAMQLTEDNFLKMLNPESQKIKSQNFQSSYFDSGNFIVFPSEYFLNTDKNTYISTFRGFILKKSQAVDIDDEEDWLIAEALYDKLHKKNT